jgi:hypothetical protein
MTSIIFPHLHNQFVSIIASFALNVLIMIRSIIMDSLSFNDDVLMTESVSSHFHRLVKRVMLRRRVDLSVEPLFVVVLRRVLELDIAIGEVEAR